MHDQPPLLGATIRSRLPGTWTPPTPEAGWSRKPELQESLRFCRQATRHHAKSFFFASFPLPREKKSAAYAVYAFCRYVDDLLDETPPEERQGLDFFARLNEELEALEKGQSQLPFAPAFAEVNRQYGIERKFYLDLIHGCCRDEQPITINNFAELEVYCYEVASVVGLMMSRIFGLPTLAGVHRAVEMGIAMQLTNILRDVGEDYAKGRIYLPADELAGAGLDPANWFQQPDHPAWATFMKGQIERARRYYRAGETGIDLLDNDGSRYTVRLMSRIYGDILRVIEKNRYDVFSRRAYVPTGRKLWIAWRCRQ